MNLMLSLGAFKHAMCCQFHTKIQLQPSTELDFPKAGLTAKRKSGLRLFNRPFCWSRKLQPWTQTDLESTRCVRQLPLCFLHRTKLALPFCNEDIILVNSSLWSDQRKCAWDTGLSHYSPLISALIHAISQAECINIPTKCRHSCFSFVLKFHWRFCKRSARRCAKCDCQLLSSQKASSVSQTSISFYI